MITNGKKIHPDITRMQRAAIEALQEATEAQITAFFASKCITLLHYLDQG